MEMLTAARRETWAQRRAARLTGVVQPYPWGSTTLLPALLGRESDGTPWAELWYGTHPAGPAAAHTPDGTRPLTELLEEGGERELPYLVKILAVERPLSLQVHPGKSEAARGYAREEAARVPRNDPRRQYPDASHKPEILVALTEFRALSGLRDPHATLRVAAALGERVGAAFRPLQEEPTSRGVLKVLTQLLEKSEENTEVLYAAREGALRALKHPDEEVRKSAELVQLLERTHPGDVGAVTALLLNDITLQPGEGLYQGPGVPHAYLSGMGVEVMAASDNVVRGGLTRKHTDPRELVQVLDPTIRGAHLVHPERSRDQVVEWDVPGEDFRLERAHPTPGHPTLASGPGIVLAIEGSVHVGEVHLGPGEGAYIPGTTLLTGNGTAYLAGSGRTARRGVPRNREATE